MFLKKSSKSEKALQWSTISIQYLQKSTATWNKVNPWVGEGESLSWWRWIPELVKVNPWVGKSPTWRIGPQDLEGRR